MDNKEMKVKIFTLPFRVGRKQQRVVLDSSGLEVAYFKFSNKNMAIDYVDWINNRDELKYKLTFDKWLEENKYKHTHSNLYKQEGENTQIHVDLLGRDYIKYFNLRKET